MYNKVPGTNNNHKRYLLSSSNTSLLKYTYISEKKWLFSKYEFIICMFFVSVIFYIMVLNCISLYQN